MATIIQKANKSIEIRYIDADGKRCSFYPGQIPKRTAESIAQKIEHIVGRQILGSEPDREVSQWLAGLPVKMYAKFVKKRLAPKRLEDQVCASPEPVLAPTVKEWTTQYIAKHPGKDSTIEQLEITARSLRKHFGEDRRIDTINAGDAEDFRKWLQTRGNERKAYETGLAEGTVRRRIGRSKQFFNSAIKHELITRNPFAGEASATGGNPERLFMVPAEWIEACIRCAPCEDWRIILAFARYAGMRSHETRIQKWEDIDLENNVMLVRSNKTPAVRRCPIFAELRPHLLRARDLAPEGAVYVQTRYAPDDNILTTLVKIIKRAGLVPWQRPMQNLRASRETELIERHGTRNVTSWLGNSPAVAHRHYTMPTQEAFDRAVREGAVIAVKANMMPTKGRDSSSHHGAGGAEKTPPKTPHPKTKVGETGQDINRQEKTGDLVSGKNRENVWYRLVKSLHDAALSCPTRT